MSERGAPTSTWPTPGAPLGDGADRPAPAGAPTLHVRRPGLPEVQIPVRPGLVIGRSPALADLVLDDDLVSRRHARFHVDPRGYFRLEDLGSRNGILFADRVVRRLNLVDGDVFRIGRTELAFSATMPRLPATAPPPSRPATIMVDARVAVPRAEPEPGDGLEGIEPLGRRPSVRRSEADPGGPSGET